MENHWENDWNQWEDHGKMADTQMYSIFRHDDAVLDGENDEAAADET